MPTGPPSLVSRPRTPRRGVSTVGLDAFLDAFLDLEATFEEEGLFDGGVWLAELRDLVGGFIVGPMTRSPGPTSTPPCAGGASRGPRCST